LYLYTAAPPKAPKQHMITAYNSDNQMLIKKRKILDPRAANILKLPPHPIPISWGRLVAPYKPPEAIAAEKNALLDCVQVRGLLHHSTPGCQIRLHGLYWLY
jgi:hypothetical protein